MDHTILDSADIPLGQCQVFVMDDVGDEEIHQPEGSDNNLQSVSSFLTDLDNLVVMDNENNSAFGVTLAESCKDDDTIPDSEERRKPT
jgi:hypothetical protein